MDSPLHPEIYNQIPTISEVKATSKNHDDVSITIRNPLEQTKWSELTTLFQNLQKEGFTLTKFAIETLALRKNALESILEPDLCKEDRGFSQHMNPPKLFTSSGEPNLEWFQTMPYLPWLLMGEPAMAPSLRSLSLRGMKEFPVSSVCSAPSHALQELDVSGCDLEMPPEQLFSCLFLHFPNLRSLSVGPFADVMKEDLEIMLRPPPRPLTPFSSPWVPPGLETLVLRKCPSLHTEHLTAISRSLPHLKHLDISGSPSISSLSPLRSLSLQSLTAVRCYNMDLSTLRFQRARDQTDPPPLQRSLQKLTVSKARMDAAAQVDGERNSKYQETIQLLMEWGMMGGGEGVQKFELLDEDDTAHEEPGGFTFDL
eukprot:gnl/Dysnectes_brevis/3521_a4468_689.p1 GENE.gnl/Dysnectes_brevis/3521_a4468_689~~gnl/Dysnectes_brevis/3521_a4468_689.p1  ORF type:complete len:408 (-),score=96.42 gnl/Dysnectes_brevis/3521_a4468_689:46-1155(-)